MGAKNAVQTEEVNAGAVQESIESLLDDLVLDSVEPEAIEEVVAEANDEAIVNELVLADEELGELDLTIAREEAYEAQASTVTTDAEAAKEAKANAPAKGKTAARASRKASGAPAVARTPRAELSAMTASSLVLEGDVSAMSDEDKDKAKAATLALMPSQKKIAEKFENLFQALDSGKLPSVYVVSAFKLLDAKKTMTSAELVAHFKSSYSQGTAMSQAGQIMNLFDTVKIATRSKNTLTLNDGSVIAQRLRVAIGA